MRFARVIVAFLGVLLCDVPGGVARGADAPATQPAMALTIVDMASAAPIAGAKITVAALEKAKPGAAAGARQAVTRRVLTSDAAGVASVSLADIQLRLVALTIEKGGYARRSIRWTGKDDGKNLPAAYIVKLNAAKAIGGAVVDEAGKPVAGATVRFQTYFTAGDNGRFVEKDELTGTATTDDKGIWTFENAPPVLKNLFVTVKADGFLDSQLDNPEQKLQTTNDQVVMHRGLALSGRVVDEAGSPIRRAFVAIDVDRGSNYANVTTDAEGKFKFPNVRPGKVLLGAKAQGHAPALKEVQASATPEVEIKLGKPHLFMGYLVDSNGMPISGGAVNVRQWGDHQIMGFLGASASPRGDFSFEGPDEPLMIEAYSSGYMNLWMYPLKPQSEPYQITMLHPLKVAGTVVDAETGKPVAKFKVFEGQGKERVFWDKYNPHDGADGKYEVSYTFPREDFRVRIEAEGYIPESSDPMEYEAKDDGKTFAFNAKMKKGSGPAGTVVDAAGKAAGGVDVLLATPDSQTMLFNGRVQENQSFGTRTKSAADGRFSFPPQDGEYDVLAMNDSGFARVEKSEFEKTPTITLEPWARIEGSLRIGKAPAAGSQAMMFEQASYDPKKPRVQNQWNIDADKEGKFVFDHVLPGEYFVGRKLEFASGSYTIEHSLKVKAEAGKTATVQIGGSGRAVLGKFKMPATLPGEWEFNFVQLQEPEPTPPISKLPDGWDKMSNEAKLAWQKQWAEQPENKAAWEKINAVRARNDSYSIAPNADYTFRVNDVAPGEYHITGNIVPALRPGTPGWDQPLAVIDAPVSVPAGTADIDVGTLEFQPAPAREK